MRKRTKWIVGIVAVLFILIIIANAGEKSQEADAGTDFSGLNTELDVEEQSDAGTADTETTASGGKYDILQQELDALQDKINELEAEDLGGLSE